VCDLRRVEGWMSALEGDGVGTYAFGRGWECAIFHGGVKTMDVRQCGLCYVFSVSFWFVYMHTFFRVGSSGVSKVYGHAPAPRKLVLALYI
jgi:hypothetical protein